MPALANSYGTAIWKEQYGVKSKKRPLKNESPDPNFGGTPTSIMAFWYQRCLSSQYQLKFYGLLEGGCCQAL